ncbi:MAG: serine/threonine-protein kinase [Isosphaeraceae bacterium]
MQTDPVPTASDHLLDPILGAYFEAESRGQAFDRAACIAAHPEHAEALRRFFENQDRLGLIVGPLHRLKEVLGTGIDDPGRSDSPPAAHDARTQSDGRPGTHVHPDWPARFGEYEILGEIARGGMGIVFEARQSRPNRIVALKMIRDLHLAGEAERQRFRIEAEAAASLDHPNIVPVLAVGEHEGTVYFTMRRIVGCDLSRRLGEYSRDPRAAAQLVAKAARAVQHAHDRGILHRDLKPSNILIDERGEPHLTDFGLAKRVEAEGGLTISGLLIGTPEYLSPEQASGEVRAVTTASSTCTGWKAVLYAAPDPTPPVPREVRPGDAAGKCGRTRRPHPAGSRGPSIATWRRSA